MSAPLYPPVFKEGLHHGEVGTAANRQLRGDHHVNRPQTVEHLRRPPAVGVRFLEPAEDLRRDVALALQEIVALAGEEVGLRGLAVTGQARVAEVAHNTVTLEHAALIASRRTVEAGHAGELVNRQEPVTLDVEQSKDRAVGQSEITAAWHGRCPVAAQLQECSRRHSAVNQGCPKRPWILLLERSKKSRSKK